MKNSRQEAVLTAILIAAGLLPFSAKADISFPKYGEELIYTLHTHLTSPSSGLPSQKEVKLAAVCFINDTENCNGAEFSNTENSSGNGSSSGGTPDYDLNDAERCRKEGYTLTSCAAGEIPDGYCIYDNKYFSKCTCPSGFKTCEPPYYGVGDACGDKYLYCEKDTERACKELNSEYTQTCQSGWKIDPNNACEYDETFGKCCNLCEGYDYTSIPEGYIADGDACVDCNGTKKYKIKINPCDGFLDCGSMGGDTDAQTCMSGSQIKYDNCKPCPNLGTLSSCPVGAKCTFEACSNLYYITSCKTNYTLSNGNCICKNTFKYTCKGTGYSKGSGTACGGKYKSCVCASGYSWIKGKCVSCDSSFRFTCTGLYESPSGAECNGKYSSCYCSNGYEWDGSSCEDPCEAAGYEYTCNTSTTHAGGEGTSCNGKYKSCKCISGYYWSSACGYCMDEPPGQGGSMCGYDGNEIPVW